MAVTLQVLQNGDDALLIWGVGGVIPNCVGFAIEKRETVNGKTTQRFLDNHVGFADQTPQPGQSKTCDKWPFQTFTWTDHTLDQGELASYRVMPVFPAGPKSVVARKSEASKWSESVKAAGATSTQAFFNRGFFMSQFVARYCAQTNRTFKQFADGLTATDEKVIREFLAGDLRVQLLKLLADTHAAGGHIYAALFELTDQELIDALVAFGDHGHFVLGNGAVDHKADDENAKARKALHDAGAEISLSDRFIAPSFLAHNKFLVATAPDGKTAERVWTGSMNWSVTGMCTQLNNAVLIEDGAMATTFLEQWQRLQTAKSKFTPELLAGNKAHDVGRNTVWFTRAGTKNADIQALLDAIGEAKHGIAFLMFQPGGKAVLPKVMALEGKPEFFLRGVVSTMPKLDGSKVDVTVVGGGAPVKHSLDVVQPDGAHGLGWWAAEITRNKFLDPNDGIGHAIIHSKVLVIDPFDPDRATVITGSHNFSGAASTENDENFVIVRGDQALAAAYLVNIMGAWRHYRWRASGQDWQGSVRADTWMAPSLAFHDKDKFFWGI
jgi:phosphatidylserine/phosphatidylglycerophosphate/cardiolipin synthase-like enzyme